ncbi:hypothetical protein ACWEOH_03765 [Agromyces sp. NPDC004153]
MTSSPSASRSPLRIVLIVVWVLVAVASAGAIVLGALTAALNGAGFDTRFSNPTPLFILVIVVNLAAGACGILLGGRWWTALLVAAPALLFLANLMINGQWVSTILVPSPLVTIVGVVLVLMLPRRRAATQA